MEVFILYGAKEYKQRLIAYTNTRFTKSTKQLQPRVLDKECFSVRFFLNGTVSLTKVCYTLEHLLILTLYHPLYEAM